MTTLLRPCKPCCESPPPLPPIPPFDSPLVYLCDCPPHCEKYAYKYPTLSASGFTVLGACLPNGCMDFNGNHRLVFSGCVWQTDETGPCNSANPRWKVFYNESIHQWEAVNSAGTTYRKPITTTFPFDERPKLPEGDYEVAALGSCAVSPIDKISVRGSIWSSPQILNAHLCDCMDFCPDTLPNLYKVTDPTIIAITNGGRRCCTKPHGCFAEFNTDTQTDGVMHRILACTWHGGYRTYRADGFSQTLPIQAFGLGNQCDGTIRASYVLTTPSKDHRFSVNGTISYSAILTLPTCSFNSIELELTGTNNSAYEDQVPQRITIQGTNPLDAGALFNPEADPEFAASYCGLPNQYLADNTAGEAFNMPRQAYTLDYAGASYHCNFNPNVAIFYTARKFYSKFVEERGYNSMNNPSRLIGKRLLTLTVSYTIGKVWKNFNEGYVFVDPSSQMIFWQGDILSPNQYFGSNDVQYFKANPNCNGEILPGFYSTDPHEYRISIQG